MGAFVNVLLLTVGGVAATTAGVMFLYIPPAPNGTQESSDRWNKFAAEHNITGFGPMSGNYVDIALFYLMNFKYRLFGKQTTQTQTTISAGAA